MKYYVLRPYNVDTHRSHFRRRVKTVTKRRQSHVNAGRVPESETPRRNAIMKPATGCWQGDRKRKHRDAIRSLNRPGGRLNNRIASLCFRFLASAFLCRVMRSEITSVARVAHVLPLRCVAGNMDVNTPASKSSELMRKRSVCSKAPRNPQKVDLCVLASFSCSVYDETQLTRFDLWPALVWIDSKNVHSSTFSSVWRGRSLTSPCNWHIIGL